MAIFPNQVIYDMLLYLSTSTPKQRMHSALIKSFILCTLTLSLLDIYTLQGVSAVNDLISDVCSKTKAPNVCSRVLRSDARARKASSLRQLGQVSMELSKSSARSTKKQISKLRGRKRDKEVKQGLRSCLLSYESALYYLGTATYYWGTGDFADVATHAAAAVNEPISCGGYFAKPPAVVIKGNTEVELLCRVVMIISNRLSYSSLSIFPQE